jgi:hypothetical protein
MNTKSRAFFIFAIILTAIAVSTLLTSNISAAKTDHHSHIAATNSTSGFTKVNNDTNSVTISGDSFTHHEANDIKF